MAGDISPAIMHQFEHACLNYFIHKKVVLDDQVSLVVNKILDNRLMDWFGLDRECISTLPFVAFVIEFRENCLAKDWEEDMLCKLLSLTQGITSFWDYTVTIQAKNSLLHGTVLH